MMLPRCRLFILSTLLVVSYAPSQSHPFLLFSASDVGQPGRPLYDKILAENPPGTPVNPRVREVWNDMLAVSLSGQSFAAEPSDSAANQNYMRSIVQVAFRGVVTGNATLKGEARDVYTKEAHITIAKGKVVKTEEKTFDPKRTPVWKFEP